MTSSIENNRRPVILFIFLPKGQICKWTKFQVKYGIRSEIILRIVFSSVKRIMPVLSSIPLSVFPFVAANKLIKTFGFVEVCRRTVLLIVNFEKVDIYSFGRFKDQRSLINRYVAKNKKK